MKKLFTLLVMTLVMLFTTSSQLSAIEDPASGGLKDGGTDRSHPWGGDELGGGGDDDGGGTDPGDNAEIVPPTFTTGIALIDFYLIKYYYTTVHTRKQVVSDNRSSISTTVAARETVATRSHILKKRIVR